MGSLSSSPPWPVRFGLARLNPARSVAREDATLVWKWLYATAVGALVLRLIAAVWSVRVGHPDEIFQYLEQAHRLVYGYGFVPWEYQFGVRNWLLPGTLGGFLEALRLVHIDSPAAYIPLLNSVFAVVSVSVVFSSYAIGRSLFGETAGRAAAVVAAIWHELLYASISPRPEILGAYAIFGALAFCVTGPGMRRAIWIGLVLGAAIALRPQYAIPAAAMWAYTLFRWERQHAFPLTIACLAVPSVAGLLDWWFWGEPFVSYFNYFEFNSTYGVSDLFGDKPIYWYAVRLTVASLGLYPVAIAYGVIIWRRAWPLLLLIACVLIPHSLIGHKEDRFVFLAILPMLPLLADMVVNRMAWMRPIAAIWIGAVVALGAAYGGVLKRDDHLSAWLDLSRRSDVKAVLDLTGPYWASGGYYYLHHDVAVYFPQVLGQLPRSDLRLFVSHIIVSAPDASIPGFRVESRHHAIAVLAQVSPPAVYRRLETNTREIPLPALSGRFSQTIRTAF